MIVNTPEGNHIITINSKHCYCTGYKDFAYWVDVFMGAEAKEMYELYISQLESRIYELEQDVLQLEEELASE